MDADMLADGSALASGNPRTISGDSSDSCRTLLTLFLIALASVLLRRLINGQYGFHRDELLTYTNARHLDWGYVPYPPITALLACVDLELFGTSLRGFRFFAAVAQSVTMLLAGLAARELGGEREAQIMAALATGIGGVLRL